MPLRDHWALLEVSRRGWGLSTAALLVAYYFPPLGGAGTQRSSKFAKFLPRFGYRPVVVTGDADVASRSAPTGDPTLAAEVGSETVVVRVPSGEGNHPSVRRRAMSAARFRVDREEWVSRAAPVVVAAAREHAAEVALVTVSPYAAAVLGDELERRLGIPWALDLRDPWTLDGWRAHPSRLHALYDRRRMVSALRSASLVIANTPAARREYIALAGLRPEGVVTIPNGYDLDDFRETRLTPPRSRFRLVHAGWLHDPAPRPPGRRRARWREVDETGRSGRYLLHGLESLRRTRPDLFRQLEVELVGHVHPGHRELALRLGVADVIVERGYLAHDQSVSALLGADMVFVPLSAVTPGEEALVVPGKLYEALGSGRPVLACLPPGDARRLVEATGAGVLGRPDSAEDIAQALIVAIEAWRAGHPLSGASLESIEAFTRHSLTRRLASVLDAMRGRGEVPAGDPWNGSRGSPEQL